MNFIVIYVHIEPNALLQTSGLRVVGVRGQGQPRYSTPEAVLWLRALTSLSPVRSIAQSFNLGVDADKIYTLYTKFR